MAEVLFCVVVLRVFFFKLSRQKQNKGGFQKDPRLLNKQIRSLGKENWKE